MIDRLKPYPAMKDSGVPWLGKVPEHWDAASLRRYCRVFAGATPSRAKPEYWNGGTIPWLASGDVNLRHITEARQFITEEGFSASSTKWIQPGSLVLALAGQGRTKGMVATVECRATCNQSLAVIEPVPGKSHYRFLAYYLESRYLDLRALVGDDLRDGLNLEHVRAISTPLPPLLEQAAIVRFLDYADRRIRRYIRAKQKLIKLLEEQKQAIIHRAVTRGLDPNVRLTPSGVEWLGDVPEHWEVVKIGYRFRCGSGSTPDGQYRSQSSSELPWIKTGELRNENITESEEYVSLRGVQAHHLPVLPIDTVLVAMYGQGLTRGRTGLLKIEASINQACLAILPNRAAAIPEYLQYWMMSQYTFLRYLSESRNATQPNLNGQMIRDQKVLLPPIEEQRRLVSIIGRDTSECAKAIRIAADEIALLREYRTRLIADVVTGKLDVGEVAARPRNEAEEPEPLDEAEEAESEAREAQVGDGDILEEAEA
jgi:type I restriction enzyme, S subunit